MINLKSSIPLIIFSNIIALIIALTTKDILGVLLFYWFENGVIGIFNVIKMILAGKNSVMKFFNIPFFIVHYGIFMLVHLIFIIVIINMIQPLSMPEFIHRIPTIIIGIVALIISHGAIFIKDYELKEKFKNIESESLLFKPYPRIIVMHLTIIFGTFAYMFFGQKFLIIILLIILKTIADILMYVRENKDIKNKKME